MSQPQNQNDEHPQFGPVNDPARRHRSMPPIGLEKDVFHLAPNIDGEEKSGEVTHARDFFSNTIVPPKEEVAKKAYDLFKKDGCQPGHDAENWAKAEAQVDPQRND